MSERAIKPTVACFKSSDSWQPVPGVQIVGSLFQALR